MQSGLAPGKSVLHLHVKKWRILLVVDVPQVFILSVFPLSEGGKQSVVYGGLYWVLNTSEIVSAL